MAITARIPAGADTAGFVPEVWSANVIDVMRMNLVAGSRVDISWKKDLKKGDTINIPILNEPSATEVTVGTEGVSNDIMTGTKLQIVIDQWWESPVTIDDMTDLQSQVDVMTRGTKLSAYAIDKKIDSTVCALFSALSGGTGYGTDGSALSEDIFIDAKEELDEADVPSEDRSWILDPSAFADIYKMDMFIRNDYVKEVVIPTGKLGQILGSPVFMTNNLTANSTGSYGAYLHRDAIGLVVQSNPKSIIVPQPLKHQKVILTDALWGVAELRDTFGCPILTRKA